MNDHNNLSPDKPVADPSLSPEQHQAAERRAKYFWVSLVVTLLGLQLVIGAVAIHLATSDPTVSVVPNYHQTALNWDQYKHAATAADRMGWTIGIKASDVPDGQGRRALQIDVHDQLGNEMDDLRLQARAYHHAAAGDIRNFAIDSIGNGNYMVLAPLGRSGIWNLKIQISGADEPITLERTIEVIQ